MSDQSDSPELERVASAAARLGMSEVTIRRWIASGTLPATRVGGTVLIGRAAVDAIVKRANASALGDDARAPLSHTMSTSRRGTRG